MRVVYAMPTGPATHRSMLRGKSVELSGSGQFELVVFDRDEAIPQGYHAEPLVNYLRGLGPSDDLRFPLSERITVDSGLREIVVPRQFVIGLPIDSMLSPRFEVGA